MGAATNIMCRMFVFGNLTYFASTDLFIGQWLQADDVMVSWPIVYVSAVWVMMYGFFGVGIFSDRAWQEMHWTLLGACCTSLLLTKCHVFTLICEISFHRDMFVCRFALLMRKPCLRCAWRGLNIRRKIAYGTCTQSWSVYALPTSTRTTSMIM